MTRPSAESMGPAWILNGHSAHVQEAQAHIARIADEIGIETSVVVTKRGDDIASLAARAVGEKRRVVVAGGGDGTVSAVAGKLVGTEAALGVLPMGTLNHFAKDAGIPQNLKAAVRNIFTGCAVSVDVGEVNGRVFVNNSGIGFYPHFVRQREEQERRGRVKRVAFILALRSIVRRYFRLRIKVHMQTQEALEHITPFLFVGNNRYRTSGPEIGTRSKLNSGRLWVCTAPAAGRRNLVRLALSTLLGRDAEQKLNAFEVEEIWVQPETERVNVSTDGEVVLMDSPLHYVSRPRALRIIVPIGEAGGGDQTRP